jgi:hypothetical protein
MFYFGEYSPCNLPVRDLITGTHALYSNNWYALNPPFPSITDNHSSGHGIHRRGYTPAVYNDSCNLVQYHPPRDCAPDNPAHAEPAQQ